MRHRGTIFLINSFDGDRGAMVPLAPWICSWFVFICEEYRSYLVKGQGSSFSFENKTIDLDHTYLLLSDQRSLYILGVM